MQEVSDLYRSIASGPYQTEVKLVIGETEYGMDKLVSLSTARSAFGSETPKLGKAVAREISATLYAESANIPRMAVLKPYVRIYNNVSNSEWIQKGVFYIDTREQINDTVSLHGYDAMLLAEAPYPESSLDWPAADMDVVEEIADALDLDISEETVSTITQQFPIQLPDQYVSEDMSMGDVFTMRDTLGGIAGLYGGVFIVNDIGELHLLCPWGGPEETNYLTNENGNYLTFGGTRILLVGNSASDPIVGTGLVGQMIVA